MLVVIQHGSRVGEVVDLPPLEARAMVTDGRARWPDDSPHAPAADPTATSERVAGRQDRVEPKAKTRRTR